MLEELTDPTEEVPMAVTKKDLEGLSGKQLKKLLEDAAALQQERRGDEIQKLRDKWTAEADESGFTVLEVLGIKQEAKPRGRTKGDGTRTPAKMKYKLPDGSEWSGKGRIPLPLREALKGVEGYSEKDSSFDSKEARAAALQKYLM